MKRGETKEHTFTLGENDYNASSLKAFLITYAQNKEKILVFSIKDLNDKVFLEENKITVKLKQEDTKKFKEGLVFVELKIFTENNEVLINEGLISFYVGETLNDEVLNEI